MPMCQPVNTQHSFQQKPNFYYYYFKEELLWHPEECRCTKVTSSNLKTFVENLLLIK